MKKHDQFIALAKCRTVALAPATHEFTASFNFYGQVDENTRINKIKVTDNPTNIEFQVGYTYLLALENLDTINHNLHCKALKARRI